MIDRNNKEENLVEKSPQQEPKGVLKYLQSKFNEENSLKEE